MRWVIDSYLFLRNILIDQVLIIGDGKKYISALVCPNRDENIKLCDAKGILYEKNKLCYEPVNGSRMAI
jgi:long-subunit acyl-CoA synthetase (AMP-forming)